MSRSLSICIALFIALGVMSNSALSKTIVTILSGISEQDKRHLYEKSLIILALEKTRDEYGDYEVVPAPSMTHARGIESMRLNKFPNFIRTFGFDPKLTEEYGFEYVRFPIHRGVTSYRTCFMPEHATEDISKIRNVDELRKFTYGMGLGWTDTDILKFNGFSNIHENANYEGLFKMAALGRIDFFCRGTNEVLNEYREHGDIAGLAHDKTFAIYYPIPLFLYANKENKIALQRIEKGLLRSIEDGSLQELWAKYYQDSIDFAQLNTRKIYYLESPFVESITFDYEKYFFMPPKKDTFASSD